MAFWNKRGKREPVLSGPDGYPLTTDDSLFEEHALIARFLEEVDAGEWSWRLSDSETLRHVRSLEPEAVRRFVLAAAQRLPHLWKLRIEDGVTWNDPRRRWHEFTSEAQLALLARKLPLTLDDLHVLLELSTHRGKDWCMDSLLIRAVENYLATEPLTPRLQELLEPRWYALRRMGRFQRGYWKLGDRVAALLGRKPDLPIGPGEPWSDQALADLASHDEVAQGAWRALFEHAVTASSSKPSARWLKTASGHVDAVGAEALTSTLVRWLSLLGTTVVNEEGRRELPPIGDGHADVLKGLVWCTSLLPSAGRPLAEALYAAAMSAYTKVPNVGPRCVRLGHACVYALGQRPGEEGIARLAILKVRVKFRPAQKGIEKALTHAAEERGIPFSEIEELGIPTYGLEEVGRCVVPLGEASAIVEVTGTTSVAMTWQTVNAKGATKIQKGVPASVRRDHAEDLADLRKRVKDIQKMLPAQRDRLDGLFLERRTWPYATWRSRYADHPLVGCLARRLIWRVGPPGAEVAVLPTEAGLVDVAGRELEAPAPDAPVALWHPIAEPVESILAWRQLLEERGITQPFKQAHRELYMLTDAERATATYSNRFAAHVIKQHQYHALCGVRGWNDRLRLMVDDYVPATSRQLPAWGLRAEYWVEGIGDDYGVDTNEAGAYLRLATDQVRFHAIDTETSSAHVGGGAFDAVAALPLTDIPPLVFSEIMRDVDLFVGVASVGNDPSWADGGPAGRHREYWEHYSFGELGESAKTRQRVLERLLPRLAIADRCRLDEKFLIVRGDLRTYRIHLGSANILMEPNGAYLCIVAGRSQTAATGDLFLPFEGDGRLSMIVSKAILLARDTKITDPSILSQIQTR
ncbi:MAG: DUF4132 domain-containing protein [Planctomycetes bacterium]|nr:DUF4132 domain-containing protein [Planctomycetota bacterium]